MELMEHKSVCRQTVTVNLENGLHMIPCSRIAQTVRNYGAEVQIHKGDQKADAGNVLDLMTLNVEYGTELTLQASGPGAEEVIKELVRLFESNFDTDGPAET